MNPNQTMPNTRGRDIALFVILLASAWIVFFFLWAWSGVIAKYGAHTLGGKPYPQLTEFTFAYRSLLQWFPSPWVLYAIYSVTKGPRSPHQLIFFSSTLIMTILTVTAITVTALVMPFISIVTSLKA